MWKLTFVPLLVIINQASIAQEGVLANSYSQPLELVEVNTFNAGIYSLEFQDGISIPGERMKKTGLTLTIIGGALFVGGIILTSQGASEYDPLTGLPTDNPKTVLGVSMLIGGAVMIIPGIVFWSKGAKKYNRYTEQQQSLSFKLRGPGVSLAYRF